MTDLKNCPFCGETADGLIVSSKGSAPFPVGHRVICTDGCSTWGPMENTEAEAIEAWNRRAKESRDD